MCVTCFSRFHRGLGGVDQRQVSAGRRKLLAGFSAALLFGSLGAKSQAQSAPPKIENKLSPDQALERLMAGNARYVRGDTSKKDFATSRAALSEGQNPYACLLSCADSRVGPEFCFDESRGDLFVTRVAGNYVNVDILGSLEYAVAVLGAPLIMVLGHSRCGAVSAAISAYEKNTDYPGHIQSLATAIVPAVQAASLQPGNLSLLERATEENVRLNVQRLATATPILRQRVETGALKVVGGIYQLDTGQVMLLS